VGHFLVGRIYRNRRGYFCARVHDLTTGKRQRMSSGEKDDEGKARNVISARLLTADLNEKARWLSQWGSVPGAALRNPPAPDRQPEKSNVPWGKAWKDWLLSLTCSEKRKDDIDYFRKTFDEHFGEKAVGDITAADVEKVKVGLHKKGRKAKTIKEYLQVLRQFFRWCKVHKLLTENPAEEIRPPRGESRQGVAFTHEEAVKLLNATRGEYEVENSGAKDKRTPPDWLFPFVFLGLRTGLRKANLLNLRWAQVDLDQRKITIEAGEMKMRRAHAVPIHAELLVYLRERKETLGPNPEDRVIGAEVSTIHNVWIRMVKRIGLKGRRIHDMRHTVETWLRPGRCGAHHAGRHPRPRQGRVDDRPLHPLAVGGPGGGGGQAAPGS
jgi:integrase